MMTANFPYLAVRGKMLLELHDTSKSEVIVTMKYDKDNTVDFSFFKWSPCGKFLAVSFEHKFLVFEVLTNRECLLECDLDVISAEFSPKSCYVSTFQALSNKNPQNVRLYRLNSGELIAKFTCRNEALWQMQFANDEEIAAIYSNGSVVFYENHNFDKYVNNLSLARLSSFSLSKQSQCHIAVYIPADKKGSPSSVKIFLYPHLGQYACIANKSFFKADDVHLKWNFNGTGLLIQAVTDVDSSGKSYYGETNIHYLSVDGTSSSVPLDKDGPVHDIKWSPAANEFCVVYGFIPSKAKLFNSNCNQIYDFGSGHRTSCYFNPQGNIIALAGFGNVRGNVELWDRQKLKLIHKINLDDITFMQWCPNGEYLLTATLSPRLKVSNCYNIFNYKGQLLLNWKVDITWQEQIFQTEWQPFPKDVFPPPKLHYTPITMESVKMQEANTKKYIPPSLRNRSEPVGKVECNKDELPENERITSSKKRGRKKKQCAEAAITNDIIVTPQQSQSARQVVGAQFTEPMGNAILDPEKAKNRIRNLNKKIKEIGVLKQRLESGEKLGKDAMNKIGNESAYLKELNQLKNNQV